MLRFKIIHVPSEDYIILSGDTIEEIREQAYSNMKKRGWLEEDCFSEVVV